jgi:hypothetical protein
MSQKRIHIEAKYQKKNFKALKKNEIPGEWHTIMFNMCKTNKEIIKRLNELVDSVTLCKPFTKCIIDKSQINILSKYINWNKLIQDSFKL